MIRILIIGGAYIHPCPNHGFLDYAKYLLESQLESSQIRIDTLLVRNLLAEDLAFGRYSSPALFYPKKLVEDADAIIIGSPIAKSAYTGLLKSFLDLLPIGILANKVILPLATSQITDHASALDSSLTPVLVDLGATQILPSVFALDNQLQDAEHSNLEIAIRLRTALQELLQAIANKETKQNQLSPLLDEVYAVH